MLKAKDFHVSDTLGFVLEEPLEFLPEYFSSWNLLAKNMPSLVQGNRMRHEVDKMPLLDHQHLQGHRQKRLAHLQLTIIASGYVWQHGDKDASKSIPKSIAVPLYYLSEELGLPPIVCHPSLALANWAPLFPDRPLCLENLRCLYTLPGGAEAEWFFLTTVMVELTFGKCIQSILSVVTSTKEENEGQAIQGLSHIADVVKQMEEVLSHMHDKLTSGTFFNVLRPYLGGYGGESSPLPEGVVFEGISDQPIKAFGGSAAQSATLQVLDALLGIQHTDGEKSFLMTMRTYMPPSHRQFVEAIENKSHSVRKFVECSNNSDLHKAYNTCLSAVARFRSYHIQIVTKYIIQARANKTTGKRFESLDNKGTGGTNLMPFLKTLRQDTMAKLVPSDNTQNGKSADN
ncbi:myoglobin-like isoform X1 [Pomacea canaliculata]|uniref:myoglobin-like isoform X1 n=1 Tax=Pomacea canaliculata TaxID=400727 RepID=UPI000D72FA46|nr:myoglobin-like isoform X1 [Pomacea canaliculata]